MRKTQNVSEAIRNAPSLIREIQGAEELIAVRYYGPAIIALLGDADYIASKSGISPNGAVDLTSDERFHGLRMLLDNVTERLVDDLNESSHIPLIAAYAITNAFANYADEEFGTGVGDNVFMYVLNKARHYSE